MRWSQLGFGRTSTTSTSQSTPRNLFGFKDGTGDDDQAWLGGGSYLAHVCVVHPDAHHGARMLRRGYNFVDGSDTLGGLDAGLFFLAYVRDPRTHFIPIQSAMAKSDAMTEYLEVTGSALFAVPPGIGPGEHVGQALFS